MATATVRRQLNGSKAKTNNDTIAKILREKRGPKSKFGKLCDEQIRLRIGDYGTHIAVSELAEEFGVTAQTARSWTMNGTLPHAFFRSEAADRKLYLQVKDVQAVIHAAMKSEQRSA